MFVIRCLGEQSQKNNSIKLLPGRSGSEWLHITEVSEGKTAFWPLGRSAYIPEIVCVVDTVFVVFLGGRHGGRRGGGWLFKAPIALTPKL